MLSDPWGNDENSLETDNPLSSGIKQIGAAVVKPTAAQIQAKRAFTDALYGNVTPSSADTDGPTADIAGAGAAHKAQSSSGATPQQAAGQLQGPAMPEDQAKLEETRKKLESLHMKTYFDPTFGEEAKKKQEAATDQAKQDEKREAEEAEELKRQKEAQMSEELNNFSAQKKAAGQPGGSTKAVMKPLSVVQSQTKAESNRGANG
jgi:hypothetical protein